MPQAKFDGYDSTFFKKAKEPPQKIVSLPDSSSKFAKFSVVRPTSSKQRPSDTKIKNRRGDRLLSAKKP